jgi:hypothetical protein
VISSQQIPSDEKDNSSHKNESETDVDGSTFSFCRMRLVPSGSSLGSLTCSLTNRDSGIGSATVDPLPHNPAAKQDEAKPYHNAVCGKKIRWIHSIDLTPAAPNVIYRSAFVDINIGKGCLQAGKNGIFLRG